MGGSESRCCVDGGDKFGDKTADGVDAAESPFRTTKVVRADPRSPSNVISRTPIELDATPIRHPKRLTRVRSMIENNHEHKGTDFCGDNIDSKYPSCPTADADILIDPRSPGPEGLRTPILLPSTRKLCDVLPDPRSPTVGIVRTPLTTEERLNEVSHCKEEGKLASIAGNSAICDTPKKYSDGPEMWQKEANSNVFESESLPDPRSPSVGIYRTPIASLEKPEYKTECVVSRNLNDPRSPTTEISRTPLGGIILGRHELRRTVLMTNALMASPLREKVTGAEDAQHQAKDKLKLEDAEKWEVKNYPDISDELHLDADSVASCSSSMVASIGSDVDGMSFNDSIGEDQASMQSFNTIDTNEVEIMGQYLKGETLDNDLCISSNDICVEMDGKSFSSDVDDGSVHAEQISNFDKLIANTTDNSCNNHCTQSVAVDKVPLPELDATPLQARSDDIMIKEDHPDDNLGETVESDKSVDKLVENFLEPSSEVNKEATAQLLEPEGETKSGEIWDEIIPLCSFPAHVSNNRPKSDQPFVQEDSSDLKYHRDSGSETEEDTQIMKINVDIKDEFQLILTHVDTGFLQDDQGIVENGQSTKDLFDVLKDSKVEIPPDNDKACQNVVSVASIAEDTNTAKETCDNMLDSFKCMDSFSQLSVKLPCEIHQHESESGIISNTSLLEETKKTDKCDNLSDNLECLESFNRVSGNLPAEFQQDESKDADEVELLPTDTNQASGNLNTEIQQDEENGGVDEVVLPPTVESNTRENVAFTACQTNACTDILDSPISSTNGKSKESGKVDDSRRKTGRRLRTPKPVHSKSRSASLSSSPAKNSRIIGTKIPKYMLTSENPTNKKKPYGNRVAPSFGKSSEKFDNPANTRSPLASLTNEINNSPKPLESLGCSNTTTKLPRYKGTPPKTGSRSLSVSSIGQLTLRQPAARRQSMKDKEN